jgi:hypothetical protein
MSFDLFYPDTPWDQSDTHERQHAVYDPLLREIYQRRSVFGRFTGKRFNHRDARAREMVVTDLVAPHPNNNEIDPRTQWLKSSYLDTYQRRIIFRAYGNKLSMHEEDDLVTYLQMAQAGQPSLVPIINHHLGQMIVDVLDVNARNAFLSNASPYRLFGNGEATDFSGITTEHKLNSDVLDDIWLGLQERGEHYMALPVSGVQGPANIVCLTTPGAMRDLRKEMGTEDQFIPVMMEANPHLLAGSARMYMWRDVLFIPTNLACLYNAGPIEAQFEVAAPILAGEGAPDPKEDTVDGVYEMGQPSRPNIKYYIQLEDADISGLVPGDVITIHRVRTDDFGITNGLDWRDGYSQNRRIVSVDNVTNRIQVEKMSLLDYDEEVDTGVYAYVTKARHIHTGTFITAPDGVVEGVAMPPSIRIPPPVDDLMTMYRVSWKARLGYNLFRPESFETVFMAGTNRNIGPSQVT